MPETRFGVGEVCPWTNDDAHHRADTGATSDTSWVPAQAPKAIPSRCSSREWFSPTSSDYRACRCLLIYLARKNAIGQCSKALLHRLKLPARLAPCGL